MELLFIYLNKHVVNKSDFLKVYFVSDLLLNEKQSKLWQMQWKYIWYSNGSICIY